MTISQDYFDQQPLLIRQGALLLWGTPLGQTRREGKIRHLFKLNDFFVEMCFSAVDGHLTCVCSFTQRPHQTSSPSRVNGLANFSSLINSEYV